LKSDFFLFHNFNQQNQKEEEAEQDGQIMKNEELIGVLPFCIKTFDENILDIKFVGTYVIYGLSSQVLIYENIGECKA